MLREWFEFVLEGGGVAIDDGDHHGGVVSDQNLY